MDSTTHQFAECVENHAMPLDGCFSGECFGDDEQTVMSATIPCACVSCVQRRVVDQFQADRIQWRQAFVKKQLDIARGVTGGGAQVGKTFLKGLTLTFA